jgi:hypothetical protein
MTCTLYCSEAGVYLITHACMVAPIEAERAYGPLQRLGNVDTALTERPLGARIEAQLDAQSFAVVTPDDAPRIWPSCRIEPPPMTSTGIGA